jgi:hypothetical protein
VRRLLAAEAWLRRPPPAAARPGGLGAARAGGLLGAAATPTHLLLRVAKPCDSGALAPDGGLLR